MGFEMRFVGSNVVTRAVPVLRIWARVLRDVTVLWAPVDQRWPVIRCRFEPVETARVSYLHTSLRIKSFGAPVEHNRRVHLPAGPGHIWAYTLPGSQPARPRPGPR